MTLKERIEEKTDWINEDRKFIFIDKLFPILDSWIAEKVAEMEKKKHQQCLKNRCVHNDAISACQKIVEDKNENY